MKGFITYSETSQELSGRKFRLRLKIADRNANKEGIEESDNSLQRERADTIETELETNLACDINSSKVDYSRETAVDKREEEVGRNLQPVLSVTGMKIRIRYSRERRNEKEIKQMDGDIKHTAEKLNSITHNTSEDAQGFLLNSELIL